MNPYLTPDWPAPARVNALTTTRPLNLIAKNPEDYLPELTLPPSRIWITQKHTAIALGADAENDKAIGDAVYTTQAGALCAVLTADCLPVLLCQKDGLAVAAIHAGWRGLAAGVIEATIAKLGYAGSELLAWMGPAISQRHFEVGSDVYAAFTATDPQAAAAFIAKENEKWMADLFALARMRLTSQGVTAIYGGNHCTYAEHELFHSYRRDGQNSGRMASLIWIE